MEKWQGVEKNPGEDITFFYDAPTNSIVRYDPNDTPQTANAFTELGYCGVLEKGTDVDYFTFDTPPGTKLAVFQAVIDGKVDFQLTLNGASFGPAETSKFGSGTYVVRAFTTAGKPASYRIRVQFDAP